MKTNKKPFWKSKIFWLILGGATLITLIWALWPEAAAHAQAAGTPEQGNEKLYKNFIDIVALVQKMFNTLLWPILFLIGGLIDNDLIFGHGMETRLYAIWVQIRNIVNILFAVALVGVALYNVLGIGGEGDQLSLKAVLPKLLVGIIAINFSYVGLKVVLDASSTLTTAVFGLPESVEQGLSSSYGSDKEQEIYGKEICINMYGNGGATKEKIMEKFKLNEAAAIEKLKTSYWCDGVNLNEKGKSFTASFNSRNAALMLALNMSKIAFIDKAIFSAKTFTSLSLNVLFSMILYFVYFASFIALFIVLIARLVVVWLGVALSPLLILTMALPSQAKEGLDIFKELNFFKHVFVPVQIALPLSIGWMMLKAFQGITFVESNTNISTSILETGTLDAGLATSGISTLQELLIAIVTVAIVWKGVFDSAKGTIAEKLVDTIKGGVEGFGKFVGLSPLKYFPIIPVGSGSEAENITPASALEVLRRLPQKIENQNFEKAQKAMDMKVPGAGPGEVSNIKTDKDFENFHKKHGKALKSGDKTLLNQMKPYYADENNNHYRGKASAEFIALRDAYKQGNDGEIQKAYQRFIDALEKKEGWTLEESAQSAATAATAATGGAAAAVISKAGPSAKLGDVAQSIQDRDLKKVAQDLIDNVGNEAGLATISENDKDRVETVGKILDEVQRPHAEQAYQDAKGSENPTNVASTAETAVKEANEAEAKRYIVNKTITEAGTQGDARRTEVETALRANTTTAPFVSAAPPAAGAGTAAPAGGGTGPATPPAPGTP